MKIRIQKLHEDAIFPKYQTNGSSGFDLHALEEVVLLAGDTILVRTGLAISTGPSYELQIRPRSGVTLNTPLRIANSPGTVDSDFSGEICVIVTCAYTNKWTTFHIKKGDRIAQGVVCPVMLADIEEVDYIKPTERGSNGFGSTGI